MCLKRSCRRTARIRHEHRGLNLHEALSVQIASDRADNLGTLHKCVLHILIHDEIDISLTISGIGIRQSVELLRQNL